MKILFATMPFDGHFNPLTDVAMHFKAVGHDIRWYAGPSYAAKLNGSVSHIFLSTGHRDQPGQYRRIVSRARQAAWAGAHPFRDHAHPSAAPELFY